MCNKLTSFHMKAYYREQFQKISKEKRQKFLVWIGIQRYVCRKVILILY